MARGFILVLDSLGLGNAPDAARFGDQGADTFGHILAASARGAADRPGLRQGPLHIPNLLRLGLGAAAGLGDAPNAAYGTAIEQSAGKDTPSGHWEMAGVPVTLDWGYFPKTEPAFPAALTKALIRRGELPGILGDCHASGTEIIERLGPEHMASGKPIVYTSADSVIQIAAHEESFGLKRLLRLCEIARELVDPYRIGRVIARPFVGEPGRFQRTGNRRDFSVPPPAPTLLDRLEAAGKSVISIGKIGDIFAHSGTGEEIKAHGNRAVMAATIAAARNAPEGSLTLANFVDFDSLFGHRRDVAGYARALEDFDAALPEFEAALRAHDLAILTADHGCDPTFPGSDHTREQVPVIALGPAAPKGPLGERQSFADIGQTLARHLGIAPLAAGTSFLA